MTNEAATAVAQLGELTQDFVTNESLIAPGGAAVSLVKPDSTRWALILCNANNTVAAWVSTKGSVTTNQGFLLPTQTPLFPMVFRDFGPITTLQWFGFAAVGGAIAIMEVFYRPLGWEDAGPDLLYELADRYNRIGK